MEALDDHPRVAPLRKAARRFPTFGARIAGLGGRARKLLPGSLKWRLTSVTLAVAAIVMLLTYLILDHAAATVASEEAERRGAETMDCFVDVVSEAVAARDRMQLQLVTTAFQRHGVFAVELADASGCMLYDTDGFTFEDSPPAPAGEESSPDASRWTTRGTQRLLVMARSISFGGVRVGSVRLALDRRGLEASIRDSSTPIFGTVSLGFLALTVLGLACLHSPFLALRKLTGAAQRIGEGDLAARVPVHGADEVAALCRAFNTMAECLAAARQEALAKQLEAIHGMINTVEAKDQYTAGHCVRVSDYVREFLELRAGYTPFEGFLIQSAALLHDLGKIGIPDRILLKTEKLTTEEAKIIQSHVTVGEEILSHMDSLKEVPLWIRHHHERWDGLGYPDGLKGEAIPFPSRVIAVADTVDAMLTDRPYRRALSIDAAIEVLVKGRATQFDPDVVDLAVACLERRNEKNDSARADGDPRSEQRLQLA